MLVYLNGAFLPKEEARLSPGDRAFLFGDGVYEALCAYRGRLFEAEAHARRFRRSLEALRIEAGEAVEEMAAVAAGLLRRNGLEDQHAKIYLQVTRGAPPERHHAFPPEGTEPTFYATASRYAPPARKWERGVKVLLHPDERWRRCDIKSTALLPNVLANQRAQEAGAFEAVLVRSGGTVTEGSHSSFAAVFGETVQTHPLGPEILPGVTREVVLELCREEDIDVREEAVPARALREADELMLWGTTTGVMPVVEVEEEQGSTWAVGAGRPGAVTRRLQHAFLAETGLASGKDFFVDGGW